MSDPTLSPNSPRSALGNEKQVRYFFDKLKALPDAADGQNVLFNSAVFVSSDVSDGNRHNHDDMPIVLGGHGGGKLNPGQHVTYTPKAKTDPKQKGRPARHDARSRRHRGRAVWRQHRTAQRAVGR